MARRGRLFQMHRELAAHREYLAQHYLSREAAMREELHDVARDLSERQRYEIIGRGRSRQRDVEARQLLQPGYIHPGLESLLPPIRKHAARSTAPLTELAPANLDIEPRSDYDDVGSFARWHNENPRVAGTIEMHPMHETEVHSPRGLYHHPGYDIRVLLHEIGHHATLGGHKSGITEDDLFRLGQDPEAVADNFADAHARYPRNVFDVAQVGSMPQTSYDRQMLELTHDRPNRPTRGTIHDFLATRLNSSISQSQFRQVNPLLPGAADYERA